jgi:hypothetical protein
MFADGESVSSVEAWGTTPPVKYFNLVFGNTWHDSMDAIIDNVVMSADPSVAGDLPAIDPPDEEEPPVIDPPDEEEPPVTDPPDEEEPPVTDPPDEEEPDGETDDRGTPPDPVEADNDSGNILSKLLDIFLQLFGLGGGDAPAPITEASAATTDSTTLSDIVPFTGMVDEDAPAGDEEEDEALDELAAA